jgi:hypothetical protein
MEINQGHLDLIRQAEIFAEKHGNHELAGELYALALDMGHDIIIKAATVIEYEDLGFHNETRQED